MSVYSFSIIVLIGLSTMTDNMWYRWSWFAKTSDKVKQYTYNTGILFKSNATIACSTQWNAVNLTIKSEMYYEWNWIRKKKINTHKTSLEWILLDISTFRSVIPLFIWYLNFYFPSNWIFWALWHKIFEDRHYINCIKIFTT